MSAFTQEQVAAALDAKAAHLSEADVQRVADARTTVEKMISEFPESWAKARRQAGLLLELLTEPAVTLESRRQAAGALIYLGAPLDLIPDDQEDGYSDDAAIVGLAIKRVEPSVRTYCTVRNLNVADYLD